MNEDLYYLRWKSIVSGPFTREDILTMLGEGRITKHHQMSADKEAWTPLFESDIIRAIRTPTGNTTTASARMSSVASTGDDNGEQGHPRLRLAETIDTQVGDRWYYAERGETCGPITLLELRSLVQADHLNKQSPICREGEEEWANAGDALPGLWDSVAAHPRFYGRPLHGRGGMQPALFEPRYAGFWRRFCAAFIDGILVGILAFAVEFIVGFAMAISMGKSMKEELMGVVGSSLTGWAGGLMLVAWAAGVMVYWIYFAAAESSMAQATPGKRALGIMVTDSRGNRISFGRATGRHFGKILSSMFLCVGYLMAAFTAKKQALHDMMADTLVVLRD